jgi:hypothetical protein
MSWRRCWRTDGLSRVVYEVLLVSGVWCLVMESGWRVLVMWPLSWYDQQQLGGLVKLGCAVVFVAAKIVLVAYLFVQSMCLTRLTCTGRRRTDSM